MGADSTVVDQPLQPMPLGDERSGRDDVWPVAMVIHPSADARLRLATALEHEGYRVIACPGPVTSTRCPARDGTDAEHCPRVPPRVELIVTDALTARTPLLDAYKRWCPAAAVTVLG